MSKPACEDTFLIKKRSLKNNYYSLVFGSYSRTGDCQPGRFVHVLLPEGDIYLRRAMSVAAVDHEKQQIEIIFKVLGRGTHKLAGLMKKQPVNLLGPLGAPFKLPRKKEKTVIVAGGIGFPPLLYLAADLVGKGYDPENIEFFYGGRTFADIIERPRIKKLGVRFHPATDDGSFGGKGFITSFVDQYIKQRGADNLQLYSCGPAAMLKAVNDLGLKYRIPGQLALEAHMPCGTGICLGCVVPLVKGGYARVCVEGPVFEIGEVRL